MNIAFIVLGCRLWGKKKQWLWALETRKSCLNIFRAPFLSLIFFLPLLTTDKRKGKSASNQYSRA